MPPPCDTDVEVVTNVEVVEEFFNVKVVELFVEAEQFVGSEFFNVKVVEELYCVEVVEEVFAFAAIRLLRGCRAPPPSSRLQGSRSVFCTYIE